MAVNRNVFRWKMVCDGGGGGSSEGRRGAEGTKGLKRGPWTAAEDTMLMEYVKKHGEGNWNAVQKNTGLARCGKSCRLRWANHLRPNLKKGSFSADEERLVIELHAKLGNKWARMAAQLPGRTDNEIKNYWNTRMKRRQRAGLPLYLHDLQKQLSPPFASHLSPPKFSLLNTMSFSLALNSLSSTNGASGFSVPVSSAFVPLSSVFTRKLQTRLLSQQALNFNYGRSNFCCNSGFSSMILGSSLEEVIHGIEAELPSIQTRPLSTTAASSAASIGDCEMNTRISQANSGLLDALLEEAQAMARNEKVKDYGYSSAVSEKERHVELEDAVENHSDDLSFSQSSASVKAMEGRMESMEEDLMSLLNNFPSTLLQPLPEC